MHSSANLYAETPGNVKPQPRAHWKTPLRQCFLGCFSQAQASAPASASAQNPPPTLGNGHPPTFPIVINHLPDQPSLPSEPDRTLVALSRTAARSRSCRLDSETPLAHLRDSFSSAHPRPQAPEFPSPLPTYLIFRACRSRATLCRRRRPTTHPHTTPHSRNARDRSRQVAKTTL